MNLTQLPYIIAIAGTGSLSGASKELGVSQSTLSRYLSDLEQEMGTELFFTVKKKMYPTQAGRKYIQTARQIMEVLDSTKNDIANLDRPVREMRVGISPHGGANTLGSAYFAFNRRFPSTRLTTREGYSNDLIDLLRKGEIDLGVGSGVEAPDITFYPNGRSEIILALPAVQVSQYPQLEHKPSGSVVASLGEFRNSVFVMSDPHAALYNCTAALMEREHFHPHVVFTSPNFTILRKMVSMGVGACLLSEGHVANNPDIYVVRLKDPVYMISGIFVRSDRPMTPEERYFAFLSLYQHVSRQPSANNLIWTDFNRALLWEYAPEEAMQLNLEVPE